MGIRIPKDIAAELDKHLESLTQDERDELRREGARMQFDKSDKAREKRREYLYQWRQRVALANRLGWLEDEKTSR